MVSLDYTAPKDSLELELPANDKVFGGDAEAQALQEAQGGSQPDDVLKKISGTYDSIDREEDLDDAESQFRALPKCLQPHQKLITQICLVMCIVLQMAALGFAIFG